MLIDNYIENVNNGGKLIIGMVHCLPLPGTLNYGGDMEYIYERAIADTLNLEKAGVDAIIVENTLDMPFTESLEIEQIAALAGITRTVVENTKLPVGVGASFNDGVAGIGIAYTTGAQFIRSSVYVDTMQAVGLGTMNPRAKEIIRYRKLIGAEHIKIFADVQVKHSHPILKEISLEESALAARDCGADVLIATGISTGYETPMEKVKAIKKVLSIPVIIGSGFSEENSEEQLKLADGAIIGSALKKDKIIENPVDYELTKSLVDKINRYREK